MKVFVLALLFLMQTQSPEDPENGPPEPGQPARCDNFKDTEAAHRCECGRAKQECDGGLPQPPADVRMDKKCKTYCRAQHCECAGHKCRS